jgi:hypothetical protein
MGGADSGAVQFGGGGVQVTASRVQSAGLAWEICSFLVWLIAELLWAWLGN